MVAAVAARSGGVMRLCYTNRAGAAGYAPKASSPVMSRPTIRMWMSWVPS